MMDAIRNKKNVIGQIVSVFFIQASSATAFAVFFSGLSLFLTQKQNYSKEIATIITGLFLSLNYFLPLIGGMIAGRLTTYKKLYCLGSLFSLSGCLILASNANLYVGLAFFLMSSFVTNVCLNMFITRLYDSNQVNERRVAFIWNYVGMNVGFLVGYFITGYSNIYNSYAGLFIMMAILIVISLILTLFFVEEYSVQSRNKTKEIVIPLLIMVFLVVIIFELFQFSNFFKKYIIYLSIVILGIVICYGFKKSVSADRKNLIKFVAYSVLAIIFWAIYMLTPTAIMQLIENDVQRKVFGLTLAPQWLVNIDSIVILGLAPLFAFILSKRKNCPEKMYSALNYFQLAFLFSAIAFFFLYMGIHYSLGYDKIPMWSMLAYLIFLTIAEIFVSPIGNSLIGELIQEPVRGVMTGAWSMNIGIGGLIASTISNLYILPYVNTDGLKTYSSVKLLSITFTVGSTLLFLAILILIMNCCLNNKKKAYNTIRICNNRG